MKHVLYKTVCVPTGHFYFGIHSSERDDAWYLGSGVKLKQMIRECGRHNFVRHIIQEFETRALAEDAETEIIQSHWKHPLCLNVRTSSKGWFKDRSAEERKLIGAKISRSMKQSDKVKEAAKKKPPPVNNWTDETKLKIALSRFESAKLRWIEAFANVEFDRIDFSKFGWVQQVANQSGLKPQKVSRALREIHPELYEKAFKRGVV